MRFILIGLVLVHLGSALNCTTGIACVDDINQKRLEYAISMDIANMNELVYDENLMKLLMEQFDKDGCAKNESGPPQRHRRQSENPWRPYIYEPDAEAIACIRTLCKRNSEDLFSFAMIEGTGNMFHGPLGSNCSLGRVPNEDGLCALPEYNSCPQKDQKKEYVQKRILTDWEKNRPIRINPDYDRWISINHFNKKSNKMSVTKFYSKGRGKNSKKYSSKITDN